MMRTFLVAASVLAASSAYGTATPAAPGAKATPRVVTILNKNLCFGRVAPETKCDFRFPDARRQPDQGEAQAKTKPSQTETNKKR